MKATLSLLVVGLAAGAAVAGAQQTAGRGYMLASGCQACHGPEGKSPGTIPSLNGKDEAFIATALKEFKSGERSATVMNRLARGYSDKEIEQIAAWWANRPPAPESEGKSGP